MSNLDMRIYTAFDGVETTIKWRDEDEYQAVKKFLQGNGVEVSGISEAGKPTGGEFFYAANNEQVQGLEEFVKSLRRKSE